ncbi:MAG: PKD domain-containing protein [Phaeodactylibacter sp.]|uniref:PKD domain-containing protein n=1 Tax=Phaeodactylibacter sp. TaxID=1940289 RepID=UPI0032ECE508
MRILKYQLFFFLLLGLFSCTEEDTVPELEGIPAPSNLSALFTIASDNSGEVTILPGGQGVTQYTVFFGDGSEESAETRPGESVTHTYTEGEYTVNIEAMGINGKVTSFAQSLTVAFVAPQNLELSILPVPGDPFSIDVAATAELETFFEVYFGETTDEEPVAFMEGETVRHTYGATGDYEVRVVARSGGTLSAEAVDTVTIANPLLMPVDFEDLTQEYVFNNFGGATSVVIDNPDMSDANPSNRVAQLNKMEGSEGWAGSFLEFGEPIDLATLQKIAIKTWAPEAGIDILLKVENAANPDLFHEVTLQNTVANEWEKLVFDFSEADFSVDYNRVVVFFNFGTAGAGEDYYFDDIEVTDGSDPVTFPVDFENANINYTFEGFGNAGASVIANPDMTAPNASANVAEFIKDEGSETWGGVFFDMSNTIDFTNNKKVRMKVWAPAADVTVVVKLENLDDSDVFIELMVQNTVANQWEEMEFDFTGADFSNDYQRVVLFFDFGNAGTGEAYYFDDIQLVE